MIEQKMGRTVLSQSTTATTVKQTVKQAELSQKTQARILEKPTTTQIWKSTTSWRIAAAVFLTIAFVQAFVLAFGTRANYQNNLLHSLKEASKTAIVPMIEERPNAVLESPFNRSDINRLFTNTKISALAVYAINLSPNNSKKKMELLEHYGEGLVLQLSDENDLGRTYRSRNGTKYEFTIPVSRASGSYIIVIRTDSSHVQKQVFDFVIETIVIMFLMSLLVTTVLMIALSRWLLEPILFMRDNLVKAFQSPENPEIPESPFDPDEEIGNAIEIAQNLIKQNASNIKQIRSAAEDKIHKLAYYDTLTGLPNRTLFLQNLAEKSRLAQNGDVTRFGVIAIDLDHFKDINDSMGHNVGDAILRGVGKRLRSALPESAIVSRSGEDEFAVMIPLATDINTANDVAIRISEVIKNEPFSIFNETFQIRASIGVSTFPDDADEPEQILKNADIALNRAKEEGRDRIKEYSRDFDRAVQSRFQMLRDLRDALERDELRLFYQPQLDLKTGKIIGAEALLRWWRKDASKEGGQFISPAEFIPIAEQSGLIVPIGEWVLKEACSTAKKWHNIYNLDIRIAINVSAQQFLQSDICSYAQKTIGEVGIDPHKVELEVTESVFMDDIKHTIQTLKELHSIGVEIAIDDFGTGYASLSNLRQFPIDRLKIDQSFIRNALNDHDDASIARTIIALGRSLNLSVIAEGVETKEHEDFLISEGCDEVQGFRYSKPIPQDDFVTFATQYNGSLDSFGS